MAEADNKPVIPVSDTAFGGVPVQVLIGASPGPLTMSSRDIAELTGKEHRHVVRDIEVMFQGLELGPEGYAQTWTHPQNGQSYREFLLPKDLTLTLIAGYSVKLRKAIIDRWQVLEGRHADPIAVLNDPAAMRGLLLTYTEKVLALEAVNAELTPKAAALDRLALADGDLSITETAKALGVRPKDLFAKLQQDQWIYKRPGGRHWLGYQLRIQAGLLTHKVTTVARSDGSEKVVEQVLVTPKGLTKLAQQAAH
jgi:phage antirepressor YoqD-like protein